MSSLGRWSGAGKDNGIVLKLSEPGCACNTESEVAELGFGGIELDSPRLTPFFELYGGPRKMKPPVLAGVTQDDLSRRYSSSGKGLVDCTAKQCFR